MKLTLSALVVFAAVSTHPVSITRAEFKRQFGFNNNGITGPGMNTPPLPPRPQVVDLSGPKLPPTLNNNVPNPFPSGLNPITNIGTMNGMPRFNISGLTSPRQSTTTSRASTTTSTTSMRQTTEPTNVVTILEPF